MPAVILAETWLDTYQDALKAAVIALLAAVALIAAHRGLARRGRKVATALAGDAGLSQEAATRLRFARRLVDTAIIVIAAGWALAQFEALDRIGNAVLASSAIAAAVVGFAARQVLANAVAGVQLAVTQPLRVGDIVTFEGETGTVEDVRLSTTWLRTPADARIVIPNERLAQGVLRNDSIVSGTVACEVSLWLGRDDDPVAAVDTLRAGLDEGAKVTIAETSAEGARLLLTGPPGPPTDRAAREAILREQGLRLLARNHG
ncbi:MAG TPA: mechanosensitive ion channel domain-containing protein [Solirubrobacteraceae bacterium]